MTTTEVDPQIRYWMNYIPLKSPELTEVKTGLAQAALEIFKGVEDNNGFVTLVATPEQEALLQAAVKPFDKTHEEEAWIFATDGKQLARVKPTIAGEIVTDPTTLRTIVDHDTVMHGQAREGLGWGCVVWLNK